MAKSLGAHRRFQKEERLAAGPAWNEQDLVVATRHGNRVSPGNFDQTLERLVAAAGVPRLTSHGLRHTAATHMVRHAADIGEIRAAADLLGHSPDMLMKVYAHALPESVRTVTDRLEQLLDALATAKQWAAGHDVSAERLTESAVVIGQVAAGRQHPLLVEIVAAVGRWAFRGADAPPPQERFAHAPPRRLEIER